MIELKGFISHSDRVLNEQGTVAAFGELSTYAKTYSSDQGLYHHAAAPKLALHTFALRGDNGVAVDAAVTEVSPGKSVAAHVLEIAQWVYSNALFAHAAEVDMVQLHNALGIEQPLIAGVDFGPFVSNDTQKLPQWISWSHSSVANSYFRVWFSDQAFRTQYDEYRIVVVPPVASVGVFFQTRTQINAALALRNAPTMVSLLQAQRAVSGPETVITIREFDWIDANDPTHPIKTQWGVLIYGLAGDDDDAIKSAIEAHILTADARTESEWAEVFPDIFKRTEFMMVPLWENYALPNLEVSSGIYSPLTSLTKASALVKQVLAYADAHIDSRLALLPHSYKHLNMLVVGGPNNRAGKQDLDQLFPDYIAEASTSLDFNRLSANTKEWMLKLDELVQLAEVVTPTTSMPLGFSRKQRDGMLYVSFSFAQVQYLMLAKINFPLN